MGKPVDDSSRRLSAWTAGLKPAQGARPACREFDAEGTGITRHVRFSKPFSRLFERQPQRLIAGASVAGHVLSLGLVWILMKDISVELKAIV